MKLCTFNLRKNRDRDLQAFKRRLPLAIDFIEKEAPDIIGFQEVKPRPLSSLRKNLPDYEIVAMGRVEGNRDEAVPLAWKKKVFTCLDFGTFWISDTPDVPGSKAYDCYWPRVCTWAKLKSDKGIVKVYNVHLDNLSEPSRQLGAKLIKESIQNDPDSDTAQIIVMGDFNVWPDSPVIATMNAPIITKSGKKITMNELTGNLEFTFQGYGKKPLEKIDYIYVNEKLKAKGIARLYESVNEAGTYISDHFPVLVDVDVL